MQVDQLSEEPLENMKRIGIRWEFAVSMLIIMSCGSDPETQAEVDSEAIVEEVCFERAIFAYPAFDLNADFPDWKSSPYTLPYAAGETYNVGQGNSTNGSHQGPWKYAYDFFMDIGTEIRAVRSGKVIHAIDGTRDGDRNGMNLVSIEHPDGSVALYLHITLNGVLVEEGEQVDQGDVIALSGDSGNTGDVPHLHFSVHSCSEFPAGPPGMPKAGSCNTLPISFRNTEPNPNGLGAGLCYTALD